MAKNQYHFPNKKVTNMSKINEDQSKKIAEKLIPWIAGNVVKVANKKDCFIMVGNELNRFTAAELYDYYIENIFQP